MKCLWFCANVTAALFSLELYLTLTLLLLPQSLSKLKLVVFESPKKPSNFFGPCLLLSSPGWEENFLSFQNLYKPPSGAMGIVYFRCEPDILKKKKRNEDALSLVCVSCKVLGLLSCSWDLLQTPSRKGLAKKILFQYFLGLNDWPLDLDVSQSYVLMKTTSKT